MINKSLEKILRSYETYYDVITENVKEPFQAEAIFHSHNEQFFLSRRIQLSEVESHEFVFFIETGDLHSEELKRLIRIAWERGLSRVKPSSNHRNSDIVLVILAKSVSPKCIEEIKKFKQTKNYRFSFHGWSSFQLIVKDETNNSLYLNRKARDHKKLYKKIFLGG